MRVDVDLSGVQDVIAAAARASVAVRVRVQAVIDRYTEIIAREARGLAPVDTGELRQSIQAELGPLASTILASAPHAAVVELGRSDNPNYPAQPFLGPAVEMHRAAFERDLRAAAEVTM